MMARRVRRPQEKADVLSRLTDRDENGPFASQVDAVVFAAALGAFHDRQEDFENSLDPMVMELFTKTQARAAMFHMLPIYNQEDLSLLEDSEEALDERVQVFEEYANGGLSVIEERLSSTGQTPEQVIHQLMHDATTGSRNSEEIDIEELADDLGFD